MKNYLKSNSAISPTDAFMDDKSYKAGPHKGLTMMEMIISLVIMAVIFAAILPQFRNIQNSWASKQTNAEVLQNGRILISHLNRNLAKAARITAVSDPCDTTGYIEFASLNSAR
jgi:prepilin-type N-terminal cleavage/methylation domain-containing protein